MLVTAIRKKAVIDTYSTDHDDTCACPFAPLFPNRVWRYTQVLLAGVLLAFLPGEAGGIFRISLSCLSTLTSPRVAVSQALPALFGGQPLALAVVDLGLPNPLVKVSADTQVRGLFTRAARHCYAPGGWPLA